MAFYPNYSCVVHGASGSVSVYRPSVVPPPSADEMRLMECVKGCSLTHVKALLDQGVQQVPERYPHDPEIMSTPLHEACKRLRSCHSPEDLRTMVTLLVENKPEALKWTINSTCLSDRESVYSDALRRFTNMKPTTPFHYAIDYTDPNDKTSMAFLRNLMLHAKRHGIDVMDERAQRMLTYKSIDLLEEIPGEFLRNCQMWQPDPQTIYTIKSLGEYRFVKRIGQGAFGSVYLAQDVASKAVRAVKMLVDPSDDEDKIHQYIMDRGGHKNVVKSFGSGRMFNKKWIVMEYIDGSIRGKVEWNDKLQKQYSKALTWLSSIGVVGTRENEMENVLIRTDGKGSPQVVLIDFGTTTDAPIGLSK
jgi:hypothetical protein